MMTTFCEARVKTLGCDEAANIIPHDTEEDETSDTIAAGSGG